MTELRPAMTDLRDRIAAVQREHRLTTWEKLGPQCHCGWRSPEQDCTFTDHPEHVADAVIRELGAIPDRSHVDDEGRVWEWCGGEPGTWAWRITGLHKREGTWGCGQSDCKSCYY